MLDITSDKVFAYDSGGQLCFRCQDFDLTGANGRAEGITWDGTYFRVLDIDSDKAFTYDSRTASMSRARTST